MAKMSREKGKRGEREFAAYLREHGYAAKRGVQYHGGPDSPDVIGLPGVHIEVKRTEQLRLYDWLDQARNDAGPQIPLIAHRKNGKGWVAIMPMDDFIRLYELAHERLVIE